MWIVYVINLFIIVVPKKYVLVSPASSLEDTKLKGC